MGKVIVSFTYDDNPEVASEYPVIYENELSYCCESNDGKFVVLTKSYVEHNLHTRIVESEDEKVSALYEWKRKMHMDCIDRLEKSISEKRNEIKEKERQLMCLEMNLTEQKKLVI